jgi:hypothetical protein
MELKKQPGKLKALMDSVENAGYARRWDTERMSAQSK